MFNELVLDSILSISKFISKMGQNEFEMGF